MELVLFELFWFLAFALAFYHFAKKFGAKEATIFFTAAFLWGYFIEFFGANFYNVYTYPAYAIKIAGVPITIAAGWAAIIYIGYYITTKKLLITKALNIDIESALIATVIDLIILEPLAFTYRFWTWSGNNFWFGAPLLNFVGWLFAITIFIAIYNAIITKTKNRAYRLAYMLVALVGGMIILQGIGFGYLALFGSL